MPQHAATIESLLFAFKVVKVIQADARECGKGYRPSGPRHWPRSSTAGREASGERTRAPGRPSRHPPRSGSESRRRDGEDTHGRWGREPGDTLAVSTDPDGQAVAGAANGGVRKL